MKLEFSLLIFENMYVSNVMKIRVFFMRTSRRDEAFRNFAKEA